MPKLTEGFACTPVDPDDLEDCRQRLTRCEAVRQSVAEFLESLPRPTRYTRDQERKDT